MKDLAYKNVWIGYLFSTTKFWWTRKTKKSIPTYHRTKWERNLRNPIYSTLFWSRPRSPNTTNTKKKCGNSKEKTSTKNNWPGRSKRGRKLNKLKGPNKSSKTSTSDNTPKLPRKSKPTKRKKKRKKWKCTVMTWINLCRTNSPEVGPKTNPTLNSSPKYPKTTTIPWSTLSPTISKIHTSWNKCRNYRAIA